MSGITKDDLLKPVITLVISLNSDPWDGATSLHEMLDVKDKSILAFVPDYKLNLLTPTDIAEADFYKFRTEFGTVVQFVKHRSDKSLEWMRGNKRFEKMHRETASLIQTVTGTKMNFTEKGDVVNMWVAYENDINQARMDGEAAGEHRGIQTGRNEGELSIMTAIRMIKENKPFSEIGEKTGLAEQRLTELKAML